MVVNPVAASVGVYEKDILDMDIVEPHIAAIASLRRASGT